MEDSWAHNLMNTHNIEDYDWSLDLHSDDFKYLSSLPEISEFDLLTLKNTKYNKTVGSTRVDTQDDEEDIDVEDLKLHHTIKSWPLVSKPPKLIAEIQIEDKRSTSYSNESNSSFNLTFKILEISIKKLKFFCN